MSTRPTDVHRTLEHASDVLTWRLLWLPVLLLAGCLFLLVYDPSVRLVLIPWIGVLLGAGWLIYATVRRAIPEPPMLVLSPEGMIWRNVSRNVIPWTVIKDIIATDHTIRYRGSKVTYENVTVVFVPRHFYNRSIFRSSLLARGPFWSNNFIHNASSTGIVIVPDLLSVDAEHLREEIVARWQAFGSQASEAASDEASRPEPLADDKVVVRDWLIYASCLLVFVFAGWALRYAVSSIQSARHAQSIAAVEETRRSFERMQAEDKVQREAEDARDRWRNSMPGSTPPNPTAVATGHAKDVSAMAVMADGRSFVSGAIDGVIKLWDVESGRAMRDIGQHDGPVRALHVMPGQARILSAGDDGKVVLRALSDGKVMHMFDARKHGTLASLALAANGKRAFSTHLNGPGILWDLEIRTLLKMSSGAGMQSAALSADGTRAITGAYDGTLWLWDADAGTLRASVGTHACCAQKVAFLPGDRQAVSAGGNDVALLWDVASGAELRSFRGHTALVSALAVSPDGKRIATGSFDRTARLWNVETGEELARLKTANNVYAVAFVDDTAILVGDGRNIRLWKTGSEVVRVFAGAEAR